MNAKPFSVIFKLLARKAWNLTSLSGLSYNLGYNSFIFIFPFSIKSITVFSVFDVPRRKRLLSEIIPISLLLMKVYLQQYHLLLIMDTRSRV